MTVRTTTVSPQEAGMRTAIGSGALAAGALFIATSIGGCASAPERSPLARAADETAAPGAGDGAGDLGAPDDGAGSDLASIAARDVDQLLALRSGAARGAVSAADASAPSGASSPPSEIVWNDSAAGAPRRTESSPIPPLARDTAKPKPPAPPPAKAAEDEPAIEPDRAPAAPTVDDLQLQLVNVRRLLYQRSLDSDRPLRELVAIAAMALVDPGLALPPGADRDLSDGDVETLERLHEFFSELGTALQSSESVEDSIARAAAELRKALAHEPELTLPAAALCWRVQGFGAFDPFDVNRFLAHAEQQVILYLEIDGFVSEENERKQWVTEVSQQLEIYSVHDRMPVWSEPWQKAVDATAKIRRDFFTIQRITLPEALSVGSYALKIRVRDERSGAEAEKSIPFEMVADPKLAARVP
jgi:hypothetical protein